MPKKNISTAVKVQAQDSIPSNSKNQHVEIKNKSAQDAVVLKPDQQHQLQPVAQKEDEKFSNPIELNLKNLTSVISTPYHEKKWPLFIESNDRVVSFFKHRDCNMINGHETSQMNPEKIRFALISAIRYGKPFVLGIQPKKSVWLIFFII